MPSQLASVHMLSSLSGGCNQQFRGSGFLPIFGVPQKPCFPFVRAIRGILQHGSRSLGRSWRFSFFSFFWGGFLSKTHGPSGNLSTQTKMVVSQKYQNQKLGKVSCHPLDRPKQHAYQSPSRADRHHGGTVAPGKANETITINSQKGVFLRLPAVGF